MEKKFVFLEKCPKCKKETQCALLYRIVSHHPVKEITNRYECKECHKQFAKKYKG